MEEILNQDEVRSMLDYAVQKRRILYDRMYAEIDPKHYALIEELLYQTYRVSNNATALSIMQSSGATGIRGSKLTY